MSVILTLKTTAQGKKDTTSISNQDLIGVWQRSFKDVGNGLEQNIRFFRDGRFEVHFADGGDDARDIYALKGTYRLVKTALYFTFTARVVYEGGKMAISGSNEDGNIFQLTGGTTKEIKEPEPKESSEPVFISIITKGNIRLDNEVYFKLSRDNLQAVGIDVKDF
jgi:hypothetical protein